MLRCDIGFYCKAGCILIEMLLMNFGCAIASVLWLALLKRLEVLKRHPELLDEVQAV